MKKRVYKKITLTKKEPVIQKNEENQQMPEISIKPQQENNLPETESGVFPKQNAEGENLATTSSPAFFKTEVLDEEKTSSSAQQPASQNEGFQLPSQQEKPANDFKIFEPEGKQNNHSFLKLLAFFAFGFILGGVAVFTFFLLNPLNLQIFSQKTTVETEEKEASVALQPTVDVENKQASESSDVKDEESLAELSVQILNGSGVAGAAAAARETLEKEGFVTFTLGNATSYNEASTEVKMKENISQKIYQIISSALSNYDLFLSKENLSSDSEFEIVITLGERK